RGIERQVFGDGGLRGWIERQECLQPHQRVNDEQAAEVKDKHADGVGHRMLFLALIDAGDSIDRELDWSQDWRKKGALTAEHTRHIGAEHGRDRDNDRAIEQYLDPADESHGFYPFRTVPA